MGASRFFWPLLTRLARPWWRLTRGQTLGVRVVVRDEQDRVLLVRHTYAPGWHLPGGGVDGGETLEQAAVRELLEETGIRAEGRPALFGVYGNFRHFARDHVALFIVEDWVQANDPPRKSLEIAETGFFPAHALPAATVAAVRRRLAEISNDAPPDVLW